MIESSIIIFGVMLSYWIDLGLSFAEPSSVSWRFPIAFQIVLALFVLLFIPGLPESPRWLVLKGKEDEALEVVTGTFIVERYGLSIRDNVCDRLLAC